MLPVLSRLSLKQKLFLSASLPMFILVLLAIVSATTLIKQYQHASANVLTTKVTLGIENVIYELQKERGLSAGYLSSNGHLFEYELQQQWLITDRAFQTFIFNSALTETINTVKNDSVLFDALKGQISKASIELQQLSTARQNISELKTPESFDFYSKLTQKLINIISQLRFKSDNSYQVLVQSDLISMLKIQELSGQERGLINKLLSAPYIDPAAFKAIAQVRNQLDNAITNAFSTMTPDNRIKFNELINSQEQQLISNYRKQLQQQIDLVEQAGFISDLVGYDGLNYNFNGYLTTLDPAYLSSFKQNHLALKATFEQIINNNNLTPKQQELIQSLELTAQRYQEYVSQTESTQHPTTTTLELLTQDIALHDSLYLLQHQAPLISSEDWWTATTAGIDSLHQINTQLTEKIARQNEIEKQQILSLLYISFFAGLLFFYLVYLLSRSIANNLIDSVSGIVNDVEQLAKDPSLELDLTVKGSDELAQISVAVNQMVSERMKSKRALHQASAVFRHSAEAIMVTDAKNRIELVNPAFTKITGYTLDDVKGKNPSVLSSAHHNNHFYSGLWHSLADKNSWEGEIWNKRKDGQIYPEYLKITAVKNSQNETIQHIGLFLDISNNKQYEQDLWYKTNYDSLTKLPNRHLFSLRLQQAIDSAQQENNQVALFFIDLDRFKFINELHGHAAGNKILKQSATRLESVLGPNDSIARIGGDEFVIISPQSNISNSTEIQAQKLSDVLSKPFILDGKETNISSSFGIAFFPEDGQDIEMLLRNSETAMYQAKRDGRAHFQYFSPEMNVEMLARMHLEQRLRKAVKLNEFYMEYQPVIDMYSGKTTSVEALIRWRDPDYGIISPSTFIPIAEETGLIEPLGEWIIHQALSDLAQLHAQGLPINMAINVSARQCINSKELSLYDLLKQGLAEHAISAKNVHIEITESMLIEDKPRCLQILESIRQLGVDIYLDDFGTGYSALSYLTQCPISVIKIDKSFIDNVLSNQSDAKLITAIVMMAQSLEMPLVAEGIETVEQWNFLRDLGCDYAQGYLMSKPLTKADLVVFLQQARPFQYLNLNTEQAPISISK
ncbi:EAL domain-containing protein [Shewanella sp. 30m-9]